MSDEKEFKKRDIRSFVVRSSRMTSGQQKAWDDYWPEIGLEPQATELDFVAIFGNDNPVVFEIGFGMGASLVEMAASAPDINFIGVEVHRPGVGALLMSAAEAKVKNLRVFCCDANELINKSLPDGALERIQLFFPDPWHKKRHNKRRLVQVEFVERIKKKIRPGGTFHMATDWEPYAEHMLGVMEALADFRNMAGVGKYSDKPAYRPTTKFENRGRQLGHGVWDLIYERAQ